MTLRVHDITQLSPVQIDEQQKLQALLLLRPSRYYGDVMEANRMPYPRQFPIDNENYFQ